MSEQPGSFDGPDLEFTEAWTAEASPSARVHDVAYAEIGARPAAVAVVGTALVVWDLESGQRLTRSPDPDPDPDPNARAENTELVRVAVTGSAGRPLAVTGDMAGRLQAWDLRSGERLGPGAAGRGRVQAVAAGQGTGAGVALVARGAGATSTVYSVPVADQGVEVWEVAAGKQVRTLDHGGYTHSIAIGEHEGRALAVASATFSASPLIDASDAESLAFLWDLETGERIGEPLEPEQPDELIGSVAVGVVEGRTVVVGQCGAGLCVWHPGHTRPRVRVPNPGRAGFVAWAGSAERPLVCVGGGDLRPDGRSRLRVWDPRDWRLLGQVEPGYGALTRYAPAPDGRVILPWGSSVKVLRYTAGR